jgi:hypothetical protein
MGDCTWMSSWNEPWNATPCWRTLTEGLYSHLEEYSLT